MSIHTSCRWITLFVPQFSRADSFSYICFMLLGQVRIGILLLVYVDFLSLFSAPLYVTYIRKIMIHFRLCNDHRFCLAQQYFRSFFFFGMRDVNKLKG